MLLAQPVKGTGQDGKSDLKGCVQSVQLCSAVSHSYCTHWRAGDWLTAQTRRLGLQVISGVSVSSLE